MKVIFEFMPHKRIYALIPTAILFLTGSVDEADNCTDLTFVWLCCGVTFRFGKENKVIDLSKTTSDFSSKKEENHV